MKKISIAKLREKLSVGTKFEAEFVGENAKKCKQGMQLTNRVVVSNKGSLISKFLDGPCVGEDIYLNLSGLRCEEDGENIFIFVQEEVKPFLRIKL